MRRFFLALGVGVQDVARSLPDVPEPVEQTSDGVIRREDPGAVLQLAPEQGDGPVRIRVSTSLWGLLHQGSEGPLRRLGQEARTSAPGVVGQRSGVEVPSEGGGPVVDALPGHAEHGGDVGGRATSIEFQHGQCPPVGAGVGGGPELLTETTALPVRELQPTHLLPS